MMEPIVFLPDILCDARLFGPQVAELSVEFPTMVLPLHSSGRMSDLAEQALAHCPARFALVGAGMGGVVAMEMLARAPERLSRIAFLATSPLQESPFSAMAYEPMLVAARAERLEDVVKELFQVTAEDAGGQLLPLMQDMADHVGVARFVNQVRAVQRHRDLQSVLRNCTAPVQVICGAEDQLIPIKRHEVMTEFIPGAELSVIPNAGHVPTLQNPSAVTKVLRHWMAQPLMLRNQ